MFKFKDHGPEDLWKNGAFALEAEIAVQDAVDYNVMTQKRVFHEYTERIWECDGVHEFEDEGKRHLAEFLRKQYDFEMPWGRDAYLSGGNHFHVFFDCESYLWWDNSGLLRELMDWQEYLPLYAKFHEGEFFHRNNNRAHDDGDSQISTGSKSAAITLKTCYTGGNSRGVYSMEFRLNNVLDARLYGYYLGTMLAAVVGVAPEIPAQGAERKRFARLMQGSRVSFSPTYGTQFTVNKNSSQWSSTDPRPLPPTAIAYPKFDIRSHPGNGFNVDMEIVKRNCEKMLDVLGQFGMVKAQAALEDYVIEKGILTR